MTPEISIAINSYRSPELLRLCLQAVWRELQGADFDFEVLVVDSATEEETEMLIREEFPIVRFFPHHDNVGFKTLVNTSIQEARGQYVFLINSDIILTREVLPAMLTYLKTHPEVGLLGPKQLNFNGSLQPSAFHFYRPETILYRRTWFGKLPFAKRHLRWFTLADTDLSRPTAVDWVIGSAMLVSRQRALEIGPMDDRFFMYMEDVDWCRRFWEQGLQVVYFPDAYVYHYHAKGSARGGFFRSLLMNRLTWYHIESAVRYFWKYRGKSIPTHKNV